MERLTHLSVKVFGPRSSMKNKGIVSSRLFQS